MLDRAAQNGVLHHDALAANLDGATLRDDLRAEHDPRARPDGDVSTHHGVGCDEGRGVDDGRLAQVFDQHSCTLVAQQVWQAIMRAQRVLRDVVPPVAGLHVGPTRRIERIDDAAARLWGLASDQQKHLALAVVDEAMGDAGAGRKRGQVAGDHAVQISTDPCVDFSFDDVDKLFFVLFRMRPR
jgi:hypothetical protein